MESQKVWIKRESRGFVTFYAFTGCDTVSPFYRTGKKKAWETWKVLPSLTKTFQELANCPNLLSFTMDEMERFDVILCSTTIECKGPVELIKRVKIGHSLQSVSDQFHVVILSLPMYFYKWLSKNFSKPTSKNGHMGILICRVIFDQPSKLAAVYL